MTKALDPNIKAARKAARAIPSAIVIAGDVAYVCLSQGLTATIDAADAFLVAGHRWHATRRFDGGAFYAVGKINGKRVLMHRLLARATATQDTDHQDGNGLNNRRGNLRPSTHMENSQNQRRRRDSASGFKGVTWHKGGRRWLAQITAAGHNHYLGMFDTAEAAHAAYAKAASELHGQFARVA